MNFSMNFSFVNQVNDLNIFEVHLAKMVQGLFFLAYRCLVDASAFIFQLVFLCRNQPKVSIKLTPNPATPDKKGASQV